MEITKEMQDVFLKKEGFVVIADATGKKHSFLIRPLASGDSDTYQVEKVSASTYLWNVHSGLFCTINKATKKILFQTVGMSLSHEEGNIFTEIGSTLDFSMRLFDEMMQILVGELFSENGTIHQDIFDEWQDYGMIPSNISESICQQDISVATKYNGDFSTYAAVAPEQLTFFWMTSALFRKESSTLMEAITWCDKHLVRTSLQNFCSFCKKNSLFYLFALADTTNHMPLFQAFLQSNAQFQFFYDLLVFSAAYRQAIRMQQEWLKLSNLTKRIAEFQKKAQSIDQRVVQRVQYQLGAKGQLRFISRYDNLHIDSISPLGIATGATQCLPLVGIQKIKYGNKILFSAE